MPTFDTPEPISATIDLAVGDVRISAGDRADTVVDVRPSDASNEADVKAAEQTRVEYADGQLLVKAPKLRSWLIRSAGGSVDVTIELPAGSHVHGDARAWATSTATAGSATAGSRPASATSGSTSAGTLEPEERRRRHQRGPRDGPRRGHGRLRRRAPRASSTAAR